MTSRRPYSAQDVLRVLFKARQVVLADADATLFRSLTALGPFDDDRHGNTPSLLAEEAFVDAMGCMPSEYDAPERQSAELAEALRLTIDRYARTHL